APGDLDRRLSGNDGDLLTVTITALPHGAVYNGDVAIRAGERLRPQDLPNLTFVPEPGFAGAAGSLRYLVDNGHGDTAEGKVDIEVATGTDTAEAKKPREEPALPRPPLAAEERSALAAPSQAPGQKMAAVALPPIPPATLPAAPPAVMRVVPPAAP